MSKSDLFKALVYLLEKLSCELLKNYFLYWNNFVFEIR